MPGGRSRNRLNGKYEAVAKIFEHARFGTLLLDLLTPEKEAVDERTAEFRFDIPLLGRSRTQPCE